MESWKAILPHPTPKKLTTGQMEAKKTPSTGGGGVRLRFFDPNSILPEWDATSPIWPIRVNQTFSRYHTGIDLDCSTGEPIYAAQGGTVTVAGWLSGYGLAVRLEHPGGFQTLYGHASRLFVRVGQVVEHGQTIAACGSTGRSTGSHLHYEVIYENQWLNPQKYLLTR